MITKSEVIFGHTNVASDFIFGKSPSKQCKIPITCKGYQIIEIKCIVSI